MAEYTVTNPTYTSIFATKWSRRVEIQEDGSVLRQGLLVSFPDDNFTQVYTFPPDEQPVILGNTVAHAAGRGGIVGRPAQSGLPPANATEMARVTSAAGTTNIRVREID